MLLLQWNISLYYTISYLICLQPYIKIYCCFMFTIYLTCHESGYISLYTFFVHKSFANYIFNTLANGLIYLNIFINNSPSYPYIVY